MTIEAPLHAPPSIEATPGRITLKIPGMRLENPTNSRQGWQRVARRSRAQKGTVRILLQVYTRHARLPVTVTITRLGPGMLDAHDNLPASAKAVCDGVAEAYGRSDNDPGFTWRYAQARTREWSVRVDVEKRET